MSAKHGVVIGGNRSGLGIVVLTGWMMLLDPTAALRVGQVLAAKDVRMDPSQGKRIGLRTTVHCAPGQACPKHTQALLELVGPSIFELFVVRAHGL
jgi:hypothetical protein